MSAGRLEVGQGALRWRAAGGEALLEVGEAAGVRAEWFPSGQKTALLRLERKGEPPLVVQGFREDDIPRLRELTGWDIAEGVLAPDGHNWGDATVEGEGLHLRNGAGELLFEAPLRAVRQAGLQGEREINLEFDPGDARTGVEERDSLVGLSFHVPEGAVGADEGGAARALLESILARADVVGGGEEPVTSVDSVSLLVPRGRFHADIHLSFLKLSGQTQDLSVQYENIKRLWVLPKPTQTVVALTLDPPLRRGATYYPHLLVQFHEEEMGELPLDISEEDFQKKNERCGGKLDREYSGPMWEIFTKALRGLSAAKVTRPGAFREASGGGAQCVRCSYKSDDGHLFPLDKAFFYIQKPPILILHDEISGVEFQRQASAHSASAKTFDLAISTKTGTEHQFRSIARAEWQNLFNFFQAKGLRISNLKQAQQGPGGRDALQLPGGGDDDGSEEESEDEDFKGDASGSDDSDGEDSEDGDFDEAD